jgi:hypothetical protein
MKPVAARLDSWIHAFVPVTPEGLAICWIVFAAFRTRLVSVVLTMAWMLGDSVRFLVRKNRLRNDRRRRTGDYGLCSHS